MNGSKKVEKDSILGWHSLKEIGGGLYPYPRGTMVLYKDPEDLPCLVAGEIGKLGDDYDFLTNFLEAWDNPTSAVSAAPGDCTHLARVRLTGGVQSYENRKWWHGPEMEIVKTIPFRSLHEWCVDEVSKMLEDKAFSIPFIAEARDAIQLKREWVSDESVSESLSKAIEALPFPWQVGHQASFLFHTAALVQRVCKFETSLAKRQPNLAALDVFYDTCRLLPELAEFSTSFEEWASNY